MAFLKVEHILTGYDHLLFLFALLVVSPLGVESGDLGIALPLFSFNLGVELGQLTAAACLLPLLARMRARPSLALRWVPVSSALVVYGLRPKWKDR